MTDLLIFGLVFVLPIALLIAPFLLRQPRWLLVYVLTVSTCIGGLWLDNQLNAPPLGRETVADSLGAAILSALTLSFAFGIVLRCLEVAVSYAIRLSAASLIKALIVVFTATIALFVVSFLLLVVPLNLQWPWLLGGLFVSFMQQTGPCFLLGCTLVSLFVVSHSYIWRRNE